MREAVTRANRRSLTQKKVALGFDFPTLHHMRHRHTSLSVLGFGGPSEKAMAPHSSTLAWKIPWAEEPGRLQSMGSLRVQHD